MKYGALKPKCGSDADSYPLTNIGKGEAMSEKVYVALVVEGV